MAGKVQSRMVVFEYNPRSEVRPDRLIDVDSAWKGIESILFDLIRRFDISCGSCLEFGVEFGYSTVSLSNYFSRVLGIDLFTGDANTVHKGDHFESTRKSLERFPNIELVRDDYKNWIERDTEKYDLIHVDIVHTYEDTYKCGLWSALHSKCTIFHDTESFPEVKRAVEAIALSTGKSFFNYPKCNGLGILVDRIPTYVYYHIAQMGNWEEVLLDQIQALLDSELYEAADRLFSGVVGDAPLALPSKFETLFHHPDIRLAEIPTLNALREHALVEDFNVLYMHTKGVAYLEKGNTKEIVTFWRRYMEYFCIGKWKECLEALDEFDAAGCEYYGVGPHFSGKIEDPHFSGNFWWARSSYLRTLPKVEDIVVSEDHAIHPRMKAEFWVGSNPNIRVKELFHHGLNSYCVEIRPEIYVHEV
jgi:hypothetical protein